MYGWNFPDSLTLIGEGGFFGGASFLVFLGRSFLGSSTMGVANEGEMPSSTTIHQKNTKQYAFYLSQHQLSSVYRCKFQISQNVHQWNYTTCSK